MKEFALIQNSRIGYDDHWGAGAWFFNAELGRGIAALQVLPRHELYRAIVTYRVTYMDELNGKPIIVNYTDDGLIRFVDFVS